MTECSFVEKIKSSVKKNKLNEGNIINKVVKNWVGSWRVISLQKILCKSSEREKSILVTTFPRS